MYINVQFKHFLNKNRGRVVITEDKRYKNNNCEIQKLRMQISELSSKIDQLIQENDSFVKCEHCHKMTRCFDLKIDKLYHKTTYETCNSRTFEVNDELKTEFKSCHKTRFTCLNCGKENESMVYLDEIDKFIGLSNSTIRKIIRRDGYIKYDEWPHSNTCEPIIIKKLIKMNDYVN